MNTTHYEQNIGLDVADHLAEARQRARQMLGGESHLGAVDDWRRALISARDAVILIWLTWVALHGFEDPPFTAGMLVVMAIGLALLVGISTARSTHTQIEYYTSELEREKAEIRNNFNEECDEIRALYAAKGFSEPLLGQIVDTLASDEDMLLKVMMEEELGLAMYHMNHPLVVGLWNFGAALAAGLVLALPVSFISRESAYWWMPIGGTVLLMTLSIIASRATRRSIVEFFAVGMITAVVTGGVVYFLAQWLADVGGSPSVA
jgi:VIT1/CCC1 family predicted Fe2+/Mn2+ transporter